MFCIPFSGFLEWIPFERVPGDGNVNRAAKVGSYCGYAASDGFVEQCSKFAGLIF